MDVKKKLQELAQEGDSASISLMRDIVINHNPYLAPFAFNLFVGIKSRDAEDAIFGVMKAYPEQYGMEGISALEETKSDHALADIYNFLSLVEMDDKSRVMHVFHALNVLHDSNNPTANKIASGILSMHPAVPGLRIDVLRERAIEGEEEAVDAIGEVALLHPESAEEVFDALLDLDTDHSKAVYEKIQLEVQASGDPDDRPDLGFLGNLGINPAPDDDSPKDEPTL